MPGTGKTFIISLMLYCMMKLGKRVLITSYTHTALDNIIKGFLNKFKSCAGAVTRLRQSKTGIDKDVSELNYDPKNFNHTDDIVDFLKQKQLFFTTCLSLRNPLLSKINFDYVVVDEASQTLEPILLESLFFSPRFVLIGDYFQLSPLVKSPTAITKGMAISLFERLAKQNPKSLCRLTDQFRMNSDIMHLANSLIYDNFLRAANESVATQKLKLTFTEDSDFSKEKQWVKDILTSQNGVIMVDIDRFNSWRKSSSEVQTLRENKIKSDSFRKRSIGAKGLAQKQPTFVAAVPKESQNDSFLLEDEEDVYLTERLEEDMAIHLIEKYIKYGVNPNQITVITPYNSDRCYLYSKLDVRNRNSEQRCGGAHDRQEPRHRPRHDRLRVQKPFRWRRGTPEELAENERSIHEGQEETLDSGLAVLHAKR